MLSLAPAGNLLLWASSADDLQRRPAGFWSVLNKCKTPGVRISQFTSEAKDLLGKKCGLLATVEVARREGVAAWKQRSPSVWCFCSVAAVKWDSVGPG